MHGDNFFKSLESMPFVANMRNNNTIDASKFLTLTEEDFSKAYPESDFTVFSQTQIDAFSGDLKAEFNQLTTEEDRKDLVEKAQKDLSKLTKVTKTDKNGKRITVYVAAKEASKPREFNVGDKIKFHSHESIRASKNKDGAGYARNVGEITHKHPDGTYSVMNEKNFITKLNHPKDNNFEHVESPKEINPNSVILSGKGTKEQYGEIGKNHYDKLSHINKIRFERDYEKHFGAKYDKETKYGEGTTSNSKRPYEKHSKEELHKLADKKAGRDRMDAITELALRNEEKTGKKATMASLDRKEPEVVKNGKTLGGNTRLHPTNEPTTEEWKKNKESAKKTENTAPKTLAEHKKGHEVYRLMQRYNPQLGTYNVFEKKKIVNSRTKSISLENDDRVYSKEHGGAKASKTGSSYGSADYSIHTIEDARKMHEDMVKNGVKVRGFSSEDMKTEKKVEEKTKEPTKSHQGYYIHPKGTKVKVSLPNGETTGEYQNVNYGGGEGQYKTESHSVLVDGEIRSVHGSRISKLTKL